MTVSAPNLTLADLLHNGIPPVASVYHILDRKFLLTSHMVKLKDKRISLTAINTVMSSKISKKTTDQAISMIITTPFSAYLMFGFVFSIPSVLR
jgi:hypothetical protein